MGAPISLRSAVREVIAMLGVLAALMLSEPVQAQTRGRSVHNQVVIGGGVSLAGGDSVTRAGPGLAGHVGLIHQRERLVLSVQAGTNYGGSASTNLAGGLRDRFDEIALLVGRAIHRSQSSQVVLAAGVASVSGERVGTGPAPFFGRTNVPFRSRIGVPLQIAFSPPGGGSGLGMTAHVNVNQEEVFGAVSVRYLIGLNRGR